MKYLLFVLFLFLSNLSFSQIILEGKVVDAKTNEPLAFCNVAIKGSTRGFNSNEEGKYRISISSESDSLIFSYIGYKTLILIGSDLRRNTLVGLQVNNVGLQEAHIVANDPFLYEALDKCRKKIIGSKPQSSKAYFQLQTDIQNQAVEMLECYYNASLKGSAIQELLLKNGRIGLAETKDHGFFTSLNTSRAISYLDLVKQNEYLPSLPLQFKLSKLKKQFYLKKIGEDASSYQIEFTPIKNKRSCFYGQVWIDKQTYAILNITLNIENAFIHPFMPAYPGSRMDSVCMNITQSYNLSEKANSLNHINFNYRFRFHNGMPYSRLNNGSTDGYSVSTSGALFFYDYHTLFVLPYFTYDENESDYRKITAMPYDDFFWKNNKELLLTDKQQQSLDFFNKNGLLINYTNKKSKLKGNYNVFKANNIIWSDTTRVALNKDNLDSLLQKDYLFNKNGQYFISDLCKLNVQIYLSLNPSKDSIQHSSATIFDIAQSYYHLPIEPYSNCFLNIYFDLCEIERRNMEMTLQLRAWSLPEMDSIYQQTVANLKQQTKDYLKDVQLGQNTKELLKWNAYVLEKLAIDNAKLFAIEKE
ncbi:MAG: hypothetical protein CFE21_08210 [Bacteroidetes bacterium B1(2017)]|nr:MAG: hypothetical protein CFE21_08210 [Bacteroidetes bacterium B1(2017)]